MSTFNDNLHAIVIENDIETAVPVDNHYFQKPILLEQLDQRIESYLDEVVPLPRSLSTTLSNYTTAWRCSD